jgi:glycosyltransferase involved in cell wall biosynthesis/2-polyprenyl-3-methyl-5-hydroxy-6-metoxy-1,4-benzoquinol methylase
MKIFIYVPGMPFDGETINKGESLGGSESAGYYVARELARRDHSVFVFSNISDRKQKTIDNVTYIPIGEPTEQTPLGHIFESYACNIPHDICLAQRAPGIFTKLFNSKLNYFWTHDLALKRFFPQIGAMLWNTNKVFAVSEWHKKQVQSVYNIPDDHIGVLRNGVDLNLFKFSDIEKKLASKTLLYSSRPERGLVNLVRDGGIMDQLYKTDPEIRLIVVGYDNTTQEMGQYYQTLWNQCEKLPNVTNYGHLSKQQLADLMTNVWLHAYPTEFEETSCITAMEEQAAGTPVIHTDVGALSETLKDGGGYVTTIEKFTDTVKYFSNNPDKWQSLHKKAVTKAKDYIYEKVVDNFEKSVEVDFNRLTSDKNRLYYHFLHLSDIATCRKIDQMADRARPTEELGTFRTLNQKLEDTQEFYEEIAQYNIDIENDHDISNHENMLKMPRLQPIIKEIEKLKKGSIVLDYGCCVGQITIALAKRFPDLEFHGCDISLKQINIGNNFIVDNNIENVKLSRISDPSILPELHYDFVICSEVLEHVDDYKQFLTDLEKSAKFDKKIMISTPFGPMEAFRNEDDHPMEHLHHFEEADIKEILKNKKDKNIVYSADPDKNGEKLGNYIWSWDANTARQFEDIDYDRKLKYQNPKQQVSCCMILNNTDSLRRTLKSISAFVSELIIGADGDKNFVKSVKSILTESKFNGVVTPIESPVKIGFDAARNLTIEKATKDWILWIDDDETFQWPERICKFIRENSFDAYAIHQHHFSAEPPGLMKTDLPCRLFRNNRGIKFYGRVHEHPEKEINKGAGNTFLIPPLEGTICHNGYDTENTRRVRFQRNFPLMVKDRTDFPNRHLGKFLWIRDLAHKNRFEFEQTRKITQEMINRANEAIELWRWFLDENQSRMVKDGLPYVAECVDLLTNGGGYDFKCALDVRHRQMGDDLNSNPNFLVGKVLTKSDLEKLNAILISEKIDPFEDNQKYL